VAGRGGYQPPAHPAPVSGVGKNSRRTDGGPVQVIRNLPDAQYGENKQFLNEQRSAPLAAGPAALVPPPSPGGSTPPPGPDLAAMAPDLNAPSARPGEPVTHGAALGPGAGPAALNLPNPQVQQAQSAADYLRQLAASSNNSAIAYLAANAQGRY